MAAPTKSGAKERQSLDNGRLLASQCLALEDHLADVKPVAKQMREWTR
jgi:hypothetical protein